MVSFSPTQYKSYSAENQSHSVPSSGRARDGMIPDISTNYFRMWIQKRLGLRMHNGGQFGAEFCFSKEGTMQTIPD